MGMMEDFEVSLQVLRGFDTDISIEVNEIKVIPKLSDVLEMHYTCLMEKHDLLLNYFLHHILRSDWQKRPQPWGRRRVGIAAEAAAGVAEQLLGMVIWYNHSVWWFGDEDGVR